MPADRTECRRRVADLFGEPIGDRRIVNGGAGISLGGELAPQRECGRAAMLAQFRQHGRIVTRIDDDRHVGVVLGRGADHGRAADVDVLDAGLEVGALGDGCFERIEADDEEVDGSNAVRAHRGGVIVIVAHGEQATVHLGMQRLHAAVHHFGKAGQLRDFEHRQPGVRQRLAGAAGRDQLDSLIG
jgi:hypothetical protein